jgi:hypothetical protein
MYILTEDSNEEQISLLVDVLNTATLSDAQRTKYIQKLKYEYGYTYIPFNDDEKIKTASLDNILDLSSFSSYNKYQDYALAIFKLRNYKKFFSDKFWEQISNEKVKELCKPYHIGVKYSKGNKDHLAYATTRDILMPENLDKGYVMHELGHIICFQQKYEVNTDGPLLDITNAPSEYGTTNGSECFAEGFTHFVFNKNYKKEFPHLISDWNKVARKYFPLVKAIIEAPYTST